jgi:hypothetical protein
MDFFANIIILLMLSYFQFFWGLFFIVLNYFTLHKLRLFMVIFSFFCNLIFFGYCKIFHFRLFVIIINFICYHKIFHVATLALGSRPRQGVARLRAKRETWEHFTCSRECKECEGMDPHTPKWTPMLGVGITKGLPNLQNAIARVKTPRLKKFFISLESYWSVDV